MLVVVAHPGSKDGPAAGDWQRAQILYVTSQLCESLNQDVEGPDAVLDVLRYNDLTNDSFCIRSSGFLHVTASISVTDFLVVVEADFSEYLKHYHHDKSWQSETLMLDSKFALTEAAFKSINLV